MDEEKGGGLVLVPGRSSIRWGSVRQDGRIPTRTSTRPPHPPHPAPCLYRTLGRTFPESCWHDEWSGLREANRSHPHEDKHQAPSSTPLRPLSLQDAGRTIPDSVGTIHWGWTLLVVRNCRVHLNYA